MIHFRTAQMPRVACRAVSPQATTPRPLAVSCPHCKATTAFRAALAADPDAQAAIARLAAAVEFSRAADAVREHAVLGGTLDRHDALSQRVKAAERAYAEHAGPRQTPPSERI